MRLVYSQTGKEVQLGDAVTTSRGDKAIVRDIVKPHKPASTGRVEIEIDGGNALFYPSVIGAEWIEREDQA